MELDNHGLNDSDNVYEESYDSSTSSISLQGWRKWVGQ